MPRIVELDGLRGLACLAVLTAHYFGEVAHGSRFLALGWGGVDVFFVLSGFLIGGILLDSRDSGNFFSTFYIRRGFRIFPIYYITIVVVLILLEMTPGELRSSSDLPVLSYFAYSQNVVMAVYGKTGSAWLLPTWTLCVEEQFYLLLPIIIFVTPKAHMRSVIIALILSGLLFRIIFALTISDRSSLELAQHVLLISRWDLLFFGVLAAHAARCPETWERLISRNFRGLKVIVLASAAVLPALALTDKAMGWMAFDLFGCSAIGATFAGFILLIVGGAREAARFRSKVLRFFGQISYCLYLVHQPVSEVMHGLILGGDPDVGNLAQFAVTVGAIGVSVGIACVSWRYLERPLIQIGHRWRYGRSTSQALNGNTRTLVNP